MTGRRRWRSWSAEPVNGCLTSLMDAHAGDDGSARSAMARRFPMALVLTTNDEDD